MDLYVVEQLPVEPGVRYANPPASGDKVRGRKKVKAAADNAFTAQSV